MKRISAGCLLLITLFVATTLRGQNAHDASIRFGKIERPGLLADYPFSKGVVESALRARLDKAGLGKPKSDKGFASYQGVSWPEIAPGQVDVYTKVDSKGDQSTTIVLLVSKGYDNYVSAASDAEMSAKLKGFLDTLLPDIQAQQLLADIGGQEEALRRAEKAYKDADNDGNKLARDKERIDRELADNAAEKAKRAEALNVEKGKLDALKARVK